MFERLKSMLIKEFKQTLRDPRMKMTIFLTPIIQLLVFGYAATMDVNRIPTAVCDLDNTPQSRDIIRTFIKSKYFDAVYYVDNDKEIIKLIDSSRVNAALHINRRFAQNLIAGRSAPFQLIIDGTNSNMAAVIVSYANGIIEKYSRKMIIDQSKGIIGRNGVLPGIDLRSRALFNENLESRNFYIPGVIAMIVTLMTLLLTSLSVVREKEIGTIEQLIVSPLQPSELILGKLLPFAAIALVQVIFVTTIGVLWFRIPVKGSFTLLVASTMVYLLVSLGIGLLISTFSSTQQEALMSTFLFFFPANLLSGFIFPVENMPLSMQYFAMLNPIKYYMTILRGTFLKGVGFEILWPQILVLLIMGLAVLAISILRFKKNLG